MESIQAWKGPAVDVDFGPEDFEILNIALAFDPELRLSAFFLKRARETDLQYPVENPEQLVTLLGESRRVTLCGHSIHEQDVSRFMPREWFPIAHEGEFISRVYLALTRCVRESQEFQNTKQSS